MAPWAQAGPKVRRKAKMSVALVMKETSVDGFEVATASFTALGGRVVD